MQDGHKVTRSAAVHSAQGMLLYGAVTGCGRASACTRPPQGQWMASKSAILPIRCTLAIADEHLDDSVRVLLRCVDRAVAWVPHQALRAFQQVQRLHLPQVRIATEAGSAPNERDWGDAVSLVRLRQNILRFSCRASTVWIVAVEAVRVPAAAERRNALCLVHGLVGALQSRDNLQRTCPTVDVYEAHPPVVAVRDEERASSLVQGDGLRRTQHVLERRLLPAEAANRDDDPILSWLGEVDPADPILCGIHQIQVTSCAV
mmetsp:Transcript_19397/g.48854  ORF Transcript_19397/g.48854 Transcript_19397/m.48854 type:complete len:260 (-) Transcript_19397:223-1002(-)